MRHIRPAVIICTLVALAVASLPSAVASTRAQTEEFTWVFVDFVPCAADEGTFEITFTGRSSWREAERASGFTGYFRAGGTWTAVPVEVTEWEWHEGHQHFHPVAWEPREGDTYSGRATFGGSFNGTPNAMTGTFTFDVQGTSSGGERIGNHFVEHFTQTNATELARATFERDRCR